MYVRRIIFLEIRIFVGFFSPFLIIEETGFGNVVGYPPPYSTQYDRFDRPFGTNGSVLIQAPVDLNHSLLGLKIRTVYCRNERPDQLQYTVEHLPYSIPKSEETHPKIKSMRCTVHTKSKFTSEYALAIKFFFHNYSNTIYFT